MVRFAARRLPDLPPTALVPAPSPAQIADLIQAGKVRLEVALSLPLAEAAKAHDQVATGHTRGKVRGALCSVAGASGAARRCAADVRPCAAFL